MTDFLAAAVRLHRHAYDVETSGPWTAETHDDGRAWVNVPGAVHAWGMHGFTGEARYVALMHPAVGRALGDMLERLAGLDRDAINGIDNDLMADLEHLAAQVLGEDGESDGR